MVTNEKALEMVKMAFCKGCGEYEKGTCKIKNDAKKAGKPIDGHNMCLRFAFDFEKEAVSLGIMKREDTFDYIVMVSGTARDYWADYFRDRETYQPLIDIKAFNKIQVRKGDHKKRAN